MSRPPARPTLRAASTLAATTAALTLAVGGLAGCGSDDGHADHAGQHDHGGSSSSGSTSSAQTLRITVTGDKVEPENKRVQVDQKKPLTLVITSDRSGELHVHSSPEQHVEFAKGRTVKKLSFKVPGVIELEEHKSDSLIAQLEVR